MKHTDGNEPVEKKIMKEEKEVVVGTKSMRIRVDGIQAEQRDGLC